MYALMSYDIATGDKQIVNIFCDKRDADELCAKECCNSDTTYYVVEDAVEGRQGRNSEVVHGSKNGRNVLCVGILYRDTKPVNTPVNCPSCLAANLPF